MRMHSFLSIWVKFRYASMNAFNGIVKSLKLYTTYISFHTWKLIDKQIKHRWHFSQTVSGIFKFTDKFKRIPPEGGILTFYLYWSCPPISALCPILVGNLNIPATVCDYRHVLFYVCMNYEIIFSYRPDLSIRIYSRNNILLCRKMW